MTDKEKESRPESSEQLPVAKNFDLLSPEPFRQDFCSEADLIISSSPNRDINLYLPLSERPEMGGEAMWIEFYGENMTHIFESIHKMAKAGFDVEMHRAGYSNIILDQDFLFLPPTRFVSKKRRANRIQAYVFSNKRLDMLKDAGARIIPAEFTRHKKNLYIKGPNRMVAWFGGMNLAEEHFRLLDFMIKFDDPRIVQALIDEFHRFGENKRTENAKIQLTENTELLIDTGKGKSLIMEEAIKDIDSAEDTIYAISAFRPSGKLLKALVRAKEERGVHIVWITSNVNLLRSIFSKQGILSPELLLWGQANFSDLKTLFDLKSRRENKIPVMFPENAGVHAKTIVVDKKSAIFGSHNFVDMHKEEQSMRSKNQTPVNNIVEFLRGIAGENLDRKLDSDFIIPGYS